MTAPTLHHDRAHGDAARLAWKNWLILAATLVVSILAILAVTLPIAEYRAQFWPWKHTGFSFPQPMLAASASSFNA